LVQICWILQGSAVTDLIWGVWFNSGFCFILFLNAVVKELSELAVFSFVNQPTFLELIRSGRVLKGESSCSMLYRQEASYIIHPTALKHWRNKAIITRVITKTSIAMFYDPHCILIVVFTTFVFVDVLLWFLV